MCANLPRRSKDGPGSARGPSSPPPAPATQAAPPAAVVHCPRRRATAISRASPVCEPAPTCREWGGKQLAMSSVALAAQPVCAARSSASASSRSACTPAAPRLAGAPRRASFAAGSSSKAVQRSGSVVKVSRVAWGGVWAAMCVARRAGGRAPTACPTPDPRRPQRQRLRRLQSCASECVLLHSLRDGQGQRAGQLAVDSAVGSLPKL